MSHPMNSAELKKGLILSERRTLRAETAHAPVINIFIQFYLFKYNLTKT